VEVDEVGGAQTDGDLAKHVSREIRPRPHGHGGRIEMESQRGYVWWRLHRLINYRCGGHCR
jgi:hypothetical protein